MAQRLEVPKFASEADEARWWFENQDLVADEFELAEREGRLGHGTVARRASAATPTWLDPADVELARRQAVSHGMEYESYLRMIMHRALEEEKKRA